MPFQHAKSNTANQAWIGLLDDVYHHGDYVSPRGRATKELIGYRSTFNMRYPMVTVFERKPGFKFMAAEAAWILSGDNRVETIAPYSKEISQFSDDGKTFYGAYGPKIRAQREYVVHALERDRDSRQAVMTIWRENPPQTKDVPCTVSVQWFIRGKYLICVDNMRSSDAWLGWPYDIFNFTMLSASILLDLRKTYPDLELGHFVMNAGSQHLYSDNEQGARLIIAQSVSPGRRHMFEGYQPFEPHKWFEHSNEVVNWLWKAAQNQGIFKAWSEFS